jgi:predicted nucleic acid-binding protein
MIKIVVDTNILIYALDESSEVHIRACEILKNEYNLLFITKKNISEYFSVCSKLEIDVNKVWGFYEDITHNLNVLYPSIDSLTYFEQLLKKYKPRGNRVYDVEIVSIMLASTIDYIATFNVDDFKNISEVGVLN